MANRRRRQREQQVPLDCDPALLSMLMAVTIKLAESDYFMWKLAVAGGLNVAPVYEPVPVIEEARALLARFDLDALGEHLVERAAEAPRSRLIVVEGPVGA